MINEVGMSTKGFEKMKLKMDIYDKFITELYTSAFSRCKIKKYK